MGLQGVHSSSGHWVSRHLMVDGEIRSPTACKVDWNGQRAPEQDSEAAKGLQADLGENADIIMFNCTTNVYR